MKKNWFSWLFAVKGDERKLTLVTTPKKRIWLACLVERGNFKDILAMINTALTLLARAIEQAEKGRAICSMNPEGEDMEELEMAFIKGIREPNDDI